MVNDKPPATNENGCIERNNLMQAEKLSEMFVPEVRVGCISDIDAMRIYMFTSGIEAMRMYIRCMELTRKFSDYEFKY